MKRFVVVILFFFFSFVSTQKVTNDDSPVHDGGQARLVLQISLLDMKNSLRGDREDVGLRSWYCIPSSERTCMGACECVDLQDVLHYPLVV
ncbi:hypothetical protein F4824DRAFT_451869 [Ustulina deusta]|nr:hypothetical protein F4824DRAFT_451869 [Ustulina deusta]